MTVHTDFIADLWRRFFEAIAAKKYKAADDLAATLTRVDPLARYIGKR